MPAPANGSGASVVRHAAGNMAIQRKLQTRGGDDGATPFVGASSFASRAGLQISAPDDPSEREADRVADDFMRGHHGGSAISTVGPAVHRHACGTCMPLEEDRVPRKAARGDSSHSSVASGAMGARIQRLEAGGHPLPVTTRDALESHMRADLGDVRMHTDGEAAALARGLNAKAFTKEQHIAFASGEYQPHSRDGQRLIAHEVTHTVQRRGANVIARQPDAPETPPAPEPPAAHPAEEVYTSALHIWHLRSGMGEAISEEEEKILENEDINARIAEEACGPEPLQVANPSSVLAPGLKDASLLYSSGPEEEPTFLDLWPVDDDLIGLSHAYAYRVYLQLLQTGADAFVDEADFWSFHDEITARACSEEETLEQLGSDAMAKTWVFPRTWAKKLESEFIPDITMSMLDSERVARCTEVPQAAQKIAPWLARQGLPIGFRESLSLSGLSADDLTRLLRQSTVSAAMMDAFFKAEERCLDATFEHNFAKRWLGWGNEIVHAVGTAHKWVDYNSATTYSREWTVGSLIRSRRATGEFAADHLRLEPLEMDISHMAYVNASVSKWLQRMFLEDILHRQFALADQMIQSLSGERRLERAGEWRSAKDFNSAARSFLWEQFDLGDVATSAGLDILANIGIGILLGPWGVLAKEVVQGGVSAAESAERISEAKKQARQATSVPDLQRAAANLSVVLQADGLNIALTIAQIPGLAKQAKHLKSATKVAVPEGDLPGVKKPAVEPPPKTATTSPTEDVPPVKAPVKDVPSATKKADVESTPKVADKPDVAPASPKRLRHEELPEHWRKALTDDDVEFLESTRGIKSQDLDDALAETELALAQRTKARKIDGDEGYVEQIDLPNDHSWKRKGDMWCRFSNGRKCIRRRERYEEGTQVRKAGAQRRFTRQEIDAARTAIVNRPKVDRLDRIGHRGAEDHGVPDDLILRALNDPHHVRVGANGNWIFYRAGTVVVVRPGANFVVNGAAQVYTAFGTGGKVPQRRLGELKKLYNDENLKIGDKEKAVRIDDYVAQNRNSDFDSFQVWP